MTDAKDAAKQVAADKEIAKQLVGKTLVLSPSVAFFVEDNGQYVLNSYDSGSDGNGFENNKNKVVVEANWKLEPSLRNIRAGILRVMDEKGNDVTTTFGGSAVPMNRKGQPLVTDGIPRMVKDDQRDKNIIKILDQLREEDVLSAFSNSNANFEVLERALQLELAGENPAFKSRAKVVDGLRELIKRTSGITPAGKLDDEEETVSASKK